MSRKRFIFAVGYSVYVESKPLFIKKEHETKAGLEGTVSCKSDENLKHFWNRVVAGKAGR